jgi:predicted DNA-binding transcriptional regulator AlpA
MKIYAGAPAAARQYVELDRGRADDYYLTEGAGIARRYTAVNGRVTELAALAGDGYEAWVGGLDPDTGTARGRLRTDDRAVRFVEAAELLRAPVATLRYWRHLGTGPRSFRLGRRVLYRRDDLQAWVEEQLGRSVTG